MEHKDEDDQDLHEGDVYVDKGRGVDRDSETELDLYNRCLDNHDSIRSEAREASLLTPLHRDTRSERINGKSELSILSILTTTEKTTLRDGTTHTKVMLKKRFSDGREECSETVHTQNAPPDDSRLSISNITKKDEMDGNKLKKRKGWFWS